MRWMHHASRSPNILSRPHIRQRKHGFTERRVLSSYVKPGVLGRNPMQAAAMLGLLCPPRPWLRHAGVQALVFCGSDKELKCSVWRRPGDDVARPWESAGSGRVVFVGLWNRRVFYPLFSQNAEQGRGDMGVDDAGDSAGAASHECNGYDAMVEASAAVAEFMVQGGLSEEDALSVSAKAPVYARRLIDADKELSELGILSSGAVATTSYYDSDPAVYRFRLLQIAFRSSGRQLAPFLESVGVRLSQIPRIAHLLSGRNLADLLEKVRFLEALLPPADGRKVGLEDQIRVMMKRLSLYVDDDLQRTLSLFEKMEAQPQGVACFNAKSKAMALLVESFPQILVRSLELQLKPVLSYLEEVGVPRQSFGRVILCFPPFLQYDVEEELKPRMKKLRAVGVRARDLGHMIVKYPWLLSRCVEDNVPTTVEFLDAVKVPKSKLHRAITKYPLLLGGSPTRTFQPMIDAMNQVGAKSRRLGGAIGSSPNLLLRGPREFQQVVQFLRDIGVESDDDVKKILLRTPEVFSSNIEKTLQRNLNYLVELGVPREQLGRVVRWYPQVLSMSVTTSIKPRMDYLQERGLCQEDVAEMVYRFPPLVGYSIAAVLKPKLDFLVDSMGKPVEDVFFYPRFFSFSLEKRIKPRAMVLARRKLDFDLQIVLSKSDQEFAAEYLGVGRMLVPTV